MRTIYSLQHLRNTHIFDSKDDALRQLSSVTNSDGSITIARYYDDAEKNIVKTLFGINYVESGMTDSSVTSASYTIFSNDDEAIKAINDKLNALPNEFKTINGETIVGSGDISIDSGVGMVDETSDGTGEIFNSYSGNVASGNFSHAEGGGVSVVATDLFPYLYEIAKPNISEDKKTIQGTISKVSGTNVDLKIADKIAILSAGGIGVVIVQIVTIAECNNIDTLRINEALNENTLTAIQSVGGCAFVIEDEIIHLFKGGTSALGDASHAEGSKTIASGACSHAEGDSTTASGNYSHAEGYFTIANAYAQHVMGRYNTSASSESSLSYKATNRAFIIGNGSNDSSRGDAFYVLFNGETHADGAYSNNGADYAEMFEWEDGNVSKEDRVGYFVTLQNDKIKVADSRSSYILGIVSSTPMVIGDNPLRWYGKYLNDEWGRPIYETIEYEEEVPLEPMDDGYDASAEEPQTKKVKRSAYVRKINPDWKNEDEYILRTKRDEWACIGLLGKLLVRQDGTLVQGGFCKVGDGGIATMSDNGYYVMKVNSDTQALILFR